MNDIERFANAQLKDLIAYQPGKPIEETARDLGLSADDIVKLASNENPYGPSPKAVKAMQEAAAGVNIYPDGAAFNLRSAIAKKYGVNFNETVVGAGSSEIIELLCHAFLNKDAELVAARHSFSMYPIMTKLFGAAFVEVPNKPDWTHDLDGFLAAITEKTRLVFITNPTNPIGTMISQGEIDRFMDKVPDHVVVCFDEAYHEFADNPPTTLPYVTAGRNVIVLRTFSKVYGLAGLRVGFGLAPESITSLLHKARTPFNTHSLAQIAALAAMDDEEHVARTVENNRREMKRYEREFDAMGLTWIPSQGNFILVNVGDGGKVFTQMLEKGVIVRDQRGYGLPEWIRISIGSESENTKCLKVLREVLGK